MSRIKTGYLYKTLNYKPAVSKSVAASDYTSGNMHRDNGATYATENLHIPRIRNWKRTTPRRRGVITDANLRRSAARKARATTPYYSAKFHQRRGYAANTVPRRCGPISCRERHSNTSQTLSAAGPITHLEQTRALCEDLCMSVNAFSDSIYSILKWGRNYTHTIHDQYRKQERKKGTRRL